jgi:hypothetical protein
MKRRILPLSLWAALLISLVESTSAQWVQTNGPSGGNIYALAVSGGTIFAGTYVGGVFRSTMLKIIVTRYLEVRTHHFL